MGNNEVLEYAVLGAGITGIAVGRILQQSGNDNFLILEAEDEIGGLCRTKEVDGHFLDIGGGHVLHSVYDEVLEWIFTHIPREDFNEYQTKVLIELEGHKIEFPIELNLWQLPVDKQIEYILSYLNSGDKSIPYDNFESWIRNVLGDKIADNYMIPYNNKLWCMDISRLNTDWLIKIPKTDPQLVLRTIIEKKSNFDTDVVSHSSFLYPKYGGFQAVINAIYEPVRDHVKMSYKVDSLKYDNDKKEWVINDSIRAKNVVNTVPWTVLNIELNNFDFASRLKDLEVLSNVISLWEREYNHDAHWMYIPDPSVDQHREFYIHNFAPYSKPNGVMTDINHKRWLDNNKKWKAGTPLYEHVNIYSYPLPTKVYKQAITEILQYCKDYNLYGLGRWGAWRYFNTDQCIKQAMDFLKDREDFDHSKIF